jgi:hypothetical protein
VDKETGICLSICFFFPSKNTINCFLWVIFRIQVLSNSGIASVLVLAVGRLAGWEDKCLDGKESAVITSLIGGIIGHYSSCNGDTWSSELGILSDAQPRLITTFKVDGYLLFFTHTHTRYFLVI